MFDFSNIWEKRLLIDAELGAVIAAERTRRGWTQETLAELAKVTPRTVQRVEKGQGANFHTRRALAQSLEYSDLDFFNGPLLMPNPEKLKAEQDKLERETTELPVTPVGAGRLLRELAELAQASTFHQIAELPEAPAETLASLQDYFCDYRDVVDCYSASQKLGVDKDFQALMDELETAGFVLYSGSHRMVMGDAPSDPKGVRVNVVYVIAAPKELPVPSVRVPRRHDFRF